MAGNADVYVKVTERIIAALEQGNHQAWVQPWTATTGRPRSVATGEPYRGINVLALAFAAAAGGYASPFWATYRQWGELGAQVRRGQKATTAIFFRELRVEREHDGERDIERIPLARNFAVFNAAQCDNVPERYLTRPATDKVLAGPQQVIDSYIRCGGPGLQFVPGDSAHYDPTTDVITLPERGQFRSAEAFYSTAFHECTHSSGASTRLARDSVTTFREADRRWGDAAYAKEEIVAQMGAAMLCAETGVEATAANDVAYIADWLQVVKDDPRVLVRAASQATRASDLVLEPGLELQKAAEKSAEVEVEDYEMGA